MLLLDMSLVDAICWNSKLSQDPISTQGCLILKVKEAEETQINKHAIIVIVLYQV